MLDKIRTLTDHLRPGATEEEPEAPAPAFRSLRVLTAEMLLVTGAEAALRSLARPREPLGYVPSLRPTDYPRPRPRAASFAAAWAPALLAPLAAAAHLKHLAEPSARTATATLILDTAVIGAGLAALADAFLPDGDAPARPSLAPLALASAGVLGRILDRHERLESEEHARLERRASVVERLVPQRRRRLDRIVVHV